MKKTIMALVVLLGVFNLLNAQEEEVENLTIKSIYKEKVKTSDGSADIWTQDNYLLKADLDLEGIDFDPSTVTDDTELRILFDATPGERYSIWKNDGNANFTDLEKFLGDSDYNHLALGDLNNDGKIDAVLVGDEQNEIWHRDAQGDYVDSGKTIDTSASDRVYLGDINNDGHVDAVLKKDTGHEVWYNDGNMNFTNSGVIIGESTASYIVLGQINGDGYLDVVIVYSHANQIWLNDKAGNFEYSGRNLGPAGSHVTLADVNGDGIADAVLRVIQSVGDDDDDDDDSAADRAKVTSNNIWINDTNAFFSDSGKTIGPEDSDDIIMGDVDGNGTVDAILYINFTNPIWLNDGNANFTDSGKTVAGTDVGSVVGLADVTGDGANDAILGEMPEDELRVYADFADFDEKLSAALNPKAYSEKFSKLKYDEKGGLVKFVTDEDVSDTDRVRLKKVNEVIAKWNEKKLTIQFKGKPPLDTDENLFTFLDEIDELEVSETVKTISKTYTYETNCKIWFAGHKWQNTEIEFSVTVTKKFKAKKDEDFEPGFWTVKTKGTIDYVSD